MRLGQMHQHREILERAEPVAQALRFVDPDAPEPRPGRLDQFHLVTVLDHAAAQFVQIVGVRGFPFLRQRFARALVSHGQAVGEIAEGDRQRPMRHLVGRGGDVIGQSLARVVVPDIALVLCLALLQPRHGS